MPCPIRNTTDILCSNGLTALTVISSMLQTGAGKTYTMEGVSSDPGINYRTMKELFRCVVTRLQAEMCAQQNLFGLL
jgi:Kinesin motor domain